MGVYKDHMTAAIEANERAQQAINIAGASLARMDRALTEEERSEAGEIFEIAMRAAQSAHNIAIEMHQAEQRRER